MNTRRLLDIIQDVKQWRGDVYKLAVLVASEQREADALKAEAAGFPELAEQIRAETDGPGQQ